MAQKNAAAKSKKQSAADKKKAATRLICLITAGIMVLSTVIAAVLSQVW